MKTFCLTKASFSCNIIFVFWGYSSAGRALEWHSRGQRFDPAYLHHRLFWPRFCVAFGFSHAFSQTKNSGSIPLISTTCKPALELRSGAFHFLLASIEHPLQQVIAEGVCIKYQYVKLSQLQSCLLTQSSSLVSVLPGQVHIGATKVTYAAVCL